ncbi:MAG: hypothetical protein L0H38_03365 [bacterium]|nr:hypothetical protein [bacterium]
MVIKSRPLRNIVSTWGVLGVIALLGFAVYRLYPFVIDLTHEKLVLWQYIIMIVWSLFMIYTEGIQAFGKQFSPRVVARARELPDHASWTRVILAPLFCIGYFAAPKKRVITAYSLAAGIITLIIIVHFIPQPWRGIIDVGVILGLVLGVLTLIYHSAKAIFGNRPGVDSEII